MAGYSSNGKKKKKVNKKPKPMKMGRRKSY